MAVGRLPAAQPEGGTFVVPSLFASRYIFRASRLKTKLGIGFFLHVICRDCGKRGKSLAGGSQRRRRRR